MIDIKIGNSFELIKTLENKSVDCVFTSPPYWGLRDYKTPPIMFDGLLNCDHQWGEEIKNPKEDLRTPEQKVNQGSRCGTSQDSINWSPGTMGSFCIKCGAWRGQLGLEPTPELFIEHLLNLFDDIKLKLKDEGNCFVNLGDSYMGGGQNTGKKEGSVASPNGMDKRPSDIAPGVNTKAPTSFKHTVIKPKSLCMIPQRFAWGMIKRGWILRNENIWAKSNHMPESVTDRWTKAHEVVYFFTKQQKNYFNLDIIRKPLATSSIKRISQNNIMNQTGGIKQEELRGNPESGNASRCNKMVQSLAIKYEGKWKENQEYMNNIQQRMNNARANGIPHDEALSHPNGKNPGDIFDITEEFTLKNIINIWKEIHPEDWNKPSDFWNINTKPYKGAHFAVFPINLVKDPILAGCPEQICVKCGKPREKIFETIGRTKVNSGDYKTEQATGKHGETSTLVTGYQNIYKEKGYSDCGCNAGFKSGVVLDPFGGSGTVGEFCKNNNRDAILFELNPEYKELIEERTKILPKKKSLFEE